MSEYTYTLFALTTHRLVTLLVGLIAIILGYRLFCRGILDKAGDLKTIWGDRSIVLRAAAPAIPKQEADMQMMRK